MTVHRVIAGLSVLLLAACGGGSNSPTGPTNSTGNTNGTGTPAPGANEVIATSGSVFNPVSLTVSKGTTVTFTFESVTHNVTFDATTGAPANIGNTSSAAVTRTFANSGSFGFQCTLHSGMRGTVVVN